MGKKITSQHFNYPQRPTASDRGYQNILAKTDLKTNPNFRMIENQYTCPKKNHDLIGIFY